jgi:hypothetical protein
MRAITTARRSCVSVRAGATRPPSRRRKANDGGGSGAGDPDKRSVFQLCTRKNAKPLSLEEIAEAYEACHRLSGAQRESCYVVYDVDPRMVELYFPTVKTLENAVGPPPSIARQHLDSARDALFQLLPPSDSPLPDHEDPDDTA